MLIRECRNWIIGTENIGEGDVAFKHGNQEYRMLNLLRNTSKNFFVPLACLVDYVGVRYIVYSLCSFTTRTLVHGSNTEAIYIENDKTGDLVSEEIADRVNLIPHKVFERVNGDPHNMKLPVDVEIHRLHTEEIYVMNVCRLMPPDFLETDENAFENNGKFLKAELVTEYNDGTLRNNFKLITWKNPVKCNECE